MERASLAHYRYIVFVVALVFVVGGQACARGSTGFDFDMDASRGEGGRPGVSNGNGGDLTLATGTASAGGSSLPCTLKGPDDDVDSDGFTLNTGDCNDCDKNTNRNAIEVDTKPGELPNDEDCDGLVDEAAEPPCDDNLPINSEDPLDAVHAADLCKSSAATNDWGVASAKWVQADGTPAPESSLANFHLGHGLLPKFGANVVPLRGTRMLVLSTGTARQPEDPGYRAVSGFTKGYQCNPPDGFPKESPSCPGKITGEPNDAVGIEMALRVPSNAHGFTFQFNFYTYEWPNYICSQYNDFFVALMSPIPEGQNDGNVSFDNQGNPVSVNNVFLDACGCPDNPPTGCLAGNKNYKCSLGTSSLMGTGFGHDTDGFDHGSTGWLQTTAPAIPNTTMTIRWVIYDSGDGNLDSSTLIDNWKWIGEPGVSVETIPIPK